MRCEELWFKTGVKDKLRFIPVHTLTEVLGTDLCNLLPAFHPLIGCDTTSALCQIGKGKGWKVLKDHADRYADMSNLGSELPPSEETVRTADRYICSLYTTSARAGETADDVK